MLQMDESWKHYPEWKKTQHLLYDSIYMKYPEQENL